MFTEIKREWESFSRWFKLALCIVFILYGSLWLFTIHINTLQRAEHIQPTLPVVTEDSSEYAALAQSLIQGNGFVRNGQLETLRTPGYPFFVAVIQAVGRSYFAITFVQILIVIISSFIIRGIGVRFVSQKVGEVAAVLFLLNPVTLTLSLLIYSDILFLLLFTGGFYAALSLEKSRFIPRILLASLLFGCAIYVRPIGLLAIPIFIAPIIVSRLTPILKWKAVGILIACLVLLISPWMARNYMRTGIFSFSSTKAFNLNWAASRFLANTNGTTVDEVNRTLEKKIGSPQSEWRDIRLSQKINSVAEGIILEKPFSYAVYHITSSLPFLFPSTIAFALDLYNGSLNHGPPFTIGAIHFLTAGNLHAFYQSIIQVWWKVLERIGWLCVSAIALYAVWYRRRDPIVYSFAFVIGYLMMLAGPAAGPRYTLQALPFLFILFVSGCGYLSKTLSQLGCKMFRKDIYP